MEDISDMQRVSLVTGATGAIGQAIAHRIAQEPGSEVVLVGRNEERGVRIARDIVHETKNERVRFETCDLSRESSIVALAKRWNGPLHLLINNGATTPRTRQETPEGIELQLATNVLAYNWMILAFWENLIASAPSRVINVASYWAGDLDLNDLEFKRRRYDNNLAYRQSKQANRMLTVAFADRLGPYGVSVNACHPGDVNSKLSNNLGFGGHETPAQGADTPAWLALDPAGQQTSGRYFARRRPESDRFVKDKAAVEKLYYVCLGYNKLLGKRS